MQALFSQLPKCCILLRGVRSSTKEEYRRYSVQLPIGLADWVDRLCMAKPQPVSASQVVVEQLAEAMQLGEQSAAELKASDLALHRAEQLAREWMFASDAHKPAAIRALVEHVLNATRRGEYPMAGDDARQVAEEADKLAAAEQARRGAKPGIGRAHRPKAD